MPHRLTLALTGASGMPYALGLLKALVARRQAVTLLVSDAAREVLRLEHDLVLPPTSPPPKPVSASWPATATA
jgi:4-hydroxy-3-polyprenylbenzoate decarboxylase